MINDSNKDITNLLKVIDNSRYLKKFSINYNISKYLFCIVMIDIN